MQAIERVAEILSSCGTSRAVLPPTALYNEGWMLRLVLDAYSHLDQAVLPLKASPGAQWLSEVLLPSPFLPRTRGDSLAEGWTHADGAIGHLTLRPGGKGDIRLASDATQFVITEAKMFSPLSAGTTRAPTYNQAARNVACMAEVIAKAKVPLESLAILAFVVLAPRSQLALPEFQSIVNRDAVALSVKQRVASYEGHHDTWKGACFDPLCKRIAIVPIAWEQAIAEITLEQPSYGIELEAFYQKCCTFSRPSAPRSA